MENITLRRQLLLKENLWYKVFIGSNETDGKLYTVFKLPKVKEDLCAITLEKAKKLIGFSHRNFSQFQPKIEEDEQFYYVLSKFCDGGSLDYAVKMKKLANEQFSEDEIAFWTLQLLDIMEKSPVKFRVSTRTVFQCYDPAYIRLAIDQFTHEVQRQEKFLSLGRLIERLALLVRYEFPIDPLNDQIPESYSDKLRDFIRCLVTGAFEHFDDARKHPFLAGHLAGFEEKMAKAIQNDEALRQHCHNQNKKPVKWGFGCTNGPNKWPEWYPIANGKCQSPIALRMSSDLFDPSLSSIQTDYSNITVTNLFSTGNSFQVNFDPNARAGKYHDDHFLFSISILFTFF